MINSELVVNSLKEKNLTISFAESATCGLLTSELVQYSNISKIFNGSLVTYSNDFKSKVLNINEKTISDYGVISKEVVYEMAFNLRKIYPADVIVSISGNAGPNNISNQETGIFFICYLINEKAIVKKHVVSKNDRKKNLKQIVGIVYQEILNLIK
jgi:PncC family amidohydrolase